MEMLLPTHPENNWQLLRRSLRLYKLSFKKVLLLSILLSTTAFIPRLLSFVIGEDIITHMTLFSLNQLWMAIINLISFIFFIGIIWHMHCVIINKQEPLLEDFSVGFKKAINVFIASTLESLLILAMIAIIIASQLLAHQYFPWIAESGLSLLILGLIFLGELTLLLYVATLFIFVVPLIAIENKGILSALQRSVMLVWNHWWRTITLQATPWICFALILVFTRFILKINIHIYLVGEYSHSLIISVFQLIIFALFIPWVAAVLLVQLQDLELRNSLYANNT